MIYFIVNPLSGNGKAEKYIPIIREYLVKNNLKFELQKTEGIGHAITLATQLKNKEDIRLIMVIGGDGTLNEVMNGIYPSSIPIGYIPAGSGNDFARENKIPLDPIAALERAIKMNKKEIDLGYVNGRYFVNAAGIGFDGKVTELANQSRWKKRLGKFVYIFALLKALLTFRPHDMTITIHNKSHTYKRVWLIAVSNGRYFGGGMKISPEAKNDDGELDVCIIKELSVLQLLKFFPTIFSGRHIYLPYVEILKGKMIQIESSRRVPIQIDGEIPENQTNQKLTFEIKGKAISIV